MNRAFMDEIVEAFTEMNADDEVLRCNRNRERPGFYGGRRHQGIRVQTDAQFLAFQERGSALYPPGGTRQKAVYRNGERLRAGGRV